MQGIEDLRPGLGLLKPDGLTVVLRPFERDQVAAALAGVERHECRRPDRLARRRVQLGEVLRQPEDFRAIDFVDPLERRKRVPVDNLAIKAELQDAGEPGQLRVGGARRVLGHVVAPFEEDGPGALPLDGREWHRAERLLDRVDVECSISRVLAARSFQSGAA